MSDRLKDSGSEQKVAALARAAANHACELLSDNGRFIQANCTDTRWYRSSSVPAMVESGASWLNFSIRAARPEDRIARYILEKQWRLGRLRTGSAVIEASSGSTSIAMALVCAQIGLKFVAVMPESVSNERIHIIKSYGGHIIF